MADYPSIVISWRGFRELPRAYQTIATEYESGYKQTRLKSTTAPRGFEFSHEACSAADAATFAAFWDARKGDTDVFNFTDPRTGAVIVCRFAGSQPPPIVPRGGGNVAFDIGPVRLEEAL